MTSASNSQSSESNLNRTLMLWFAALAVTWVSGIEPTWRKVHDTAVNFERVNWHRHEANRQTIALQKSIEAERAWLPRLQQFKIGYPSVEARQAARKALYNTLLRSEAAVNKSGVILPEASALRGMTPDGICTSPAWANSVPIPLGENPAERDLARAIDRLRNFCELERRLDQLSPGEQERRLESQKQIILSGERADQTTLAEARMRAEKVRTEADVDFELLGLKFKSAPLLASFLWSGFAFAWLLSAREEVIKSRQIAETESASPDPKQSHGASVISLLALLAWAMQLRVAWVGMGITALQGEMKWKALVAVALCLLVLGSACVVALLFTNRADLDDSPTDYLTKWRKLVPGILLLSAAASISVWWIPGAVLKLAQGIIPALPLISALPLLLIVSSWLLRRLASGTAPVSARRRVLLMGWAGVVAVVLSGGWIRAPARRHRRAAAMDGEPAPVKAGFYRRTAPLRSK